MEFTGVDFSDGAVFYRITFQKNGWRKFETVFFGENNIGKQLDLARVKPQIYMPYFTGAKFSQEMRCTYACSQMFCIQISGLLERADLWKQVFLSVTPVSVLFFDGFLVCVGYYVCVCIDRCLSTWICSQLKCAGSQAADWQMQSGASFSDRVSFSNNTAKVYLQILSATEEWTQRAKAECSCI